MENKPKTDKPATGKPATGKPSSEKKGSPIGNNIVWYLLGIGLTILLVVGWLHQESAYEIPTSKLQDLIKAGSEGITISEGPDNRLVRYKNPTDIVLSPTEITGKVERTVITPGMPKAVKKNRQHRQSSQLPN